ncbi:hypothetical protein [Anaerotignum neopropionicum]|nr:hypothetical protein [Anaerotignum neopropionicum]
MKILVKDEKRRASITRSERRQTLGVALSLPKIGQTAKLAFA